MPLSCDCNTDFYPEDPGEWRFSFPDDFITLTTKRRRRCKSCGNLIDRGAPCLEFLRERAAYSEVEAEINKGNPIPMAPLFFCEQCGEIYLNLHEAGFCLSPENDMREAMKEYWGMSGFKPALTGSKP